ncbi:2-dehydropantoate 2-reductase [Alkalihalobacillus sp. MEB130]|uniref:2-dehydropantoate 2-reductase n=1 Tax=Alkalihalobacillus sp. MEB130 TaxID=2976704 RepID=UPI0028E05DF3|nr:2-dehydropantoate 2-reductase [Alkalihalobacillus sp. MEB130]MDT8859132.1 2-dehydropantoate 2-reductase [Alkalihalobacillus sp. MEB130]
MNVVIIGSGSIGMLMAFYFTKLGCPVSLVTNRVEQADDLNQNGLHLFYSEKTIKKVSILAMNVQQLTQLTDVDLLIVTVKSHQVEHVIKQIDENQLNIFSVLFLQNGMSHTELFHQISVPEIAVGVMEHGAMRTNNVTVRHTGIGMLKWSYVRQKSQFIERLFSQLNEEHFPIEKQQNWKQLLQRKLVVNACINPITAIFAIPNGMLVKNDYYFSMMRQVFVEVTDILGIENQEGLWKYVCQVCEKTSRNRSSMLVDIDSHRETEVDSIVGYLLRQASAKQMNVPVLTFLYRAIRAKEQTYELGGTTL